MKFNFLNKEKLPRWMKKYFTPNASFTIKAKGRFLATFDAHHGIAPGTATLASASSRWMMALKVTAGVLAVAAIAFGGASVYADQANVAADSPLYPLKRISESVQLALAPVAAKPQLEATFAARRAAEIAKLAAGHPTSTILPQLENDLTDDITASIGGAERVASTGNGGGNATGTNADRGQNFRSGGSAASTSEVRTVCTTLQPILDTSSSATSALGEDISVHAEIFARFKARCSLGSTSGTVSSTTILPPFRFRDSTSNVTTSVSTASGAPTYPPDRHYGRDGGDRGGTENMTTTVTTTIVATSGVNGEPPVHSPSPPPVSPIPNLHLPL